MEFNGRTPAQIATWGAHMRSYYRRGLLSQEQIDACESMDKDWSWDYVCNRKFRPFEEARTFVRSLGLKSGTEWRAYVSLSALPNIPTNPVPVYKDKGWVSWPDWFGTATAPKPNRTLFLPFEGARAFARSLGLKSKAEWRAYYKLNRPKNMPSYLDAYYKDKGWVNWGDFLGTGNVAFSKKTFRPFEEARAFVRALGLKRQKEWISYAGSDKRPLDIPSDPHLFYAGKGWVGYGDWLGTGNLGNKARTGTGRYTRVKSAGA